MIDAREGLRRLVASRRERALKLPISPALRLIRVQNRPEYRYMDENRKRQHGFLPKFVL